MMEKPLISVIIPVYNVEKYIDKCVESVVRQTYKNLEIWLVDDGSTDSSGVYCQKWAEKDERINVIHQKNQGLSAARNIAIDKCSGEWLVFVDSDDVVDARYVEILYGLVQKGALIAQCENGEIGRLGEKQESIICSSMTSRDFLLSDKYKTMAWGKIYAKKLFETERYPYGKIHEDLALTYKLVYEAGRVEYTNEILYFYNERPDSINAKNRFYYEKLVVLDFYKEQIEFYREKKERELEQQSIRNYGYELLIDYNKTKDRLHDMDIAKKIKEEYQTIFKKMIRDEKISVKTKLMLRICYYIPKFWKFIM